MVQSVNITKLNLLQLEMLKNQLDQDMEFLSTSTAQLKVVSSKYVEAKHCLNMLNNSNEGKELLVPLTSSIYVPRKLHNVEYMLINMETGYYVEQTAEDAKDDFKRKTDFLTKQMEKIQPALQEKHAMKQAVMKMMNQKIQQLAALGTAQPTAKAGICCRNGAEGPCFRGLELLRGLLFAGKSVCSGRRFQSAQLP
ncbi:prefoldin subunit 5-like [Cynocephalus volans]|uniref:prefoldin subunit 5-like n=1 Tax=Cynocephalus volans TaxID=110931 RepID=UPI002FC7750A